VQQVNAITAAMREVAIEIISQHLKAGLILAADERDGPEIMGDLASVIRAALRQG
jgi:DNA-binding FrmR family transcriptional regulator